MTTPNLEQQIDTCMDKINPLLNNLKPSTQILAHNILSYSAIQIRGFEDVQQIINTLLVCSPDTNHSDNPIITAANTVKQIQTIVHGQAQGSEYSEADLMSFVLDDLQHQQLNLAA